jgi:hypothetical protein
MELLNTMRKTFADAALQDIQQRAQSRIDQDRRGQRGDVGQPVPALSVDAGRGGLCPCHAPSSAEHLRQNRLQRRAAGALVSPQLRPSDVRLPACLQC